MQLLFDTWNVFCGNDLKYSRKHGGSPFFGIGEVWDVDEPL